MNSRYYIYLYICVFLLRCDKMNYVFFIIIILEKLFILYVFIKLIFNGVVCRNESILLFVKIKLNIKKKKYE